MPGPQDSLVTQLVGALSGVLARVAEPEAVLSLLLQQAVAVTGATRGVFVEVSPGGEYALSVLHSHRADQLRDPGHFSRSIFARCLQTGEDVMLANASAETPADTRRSAVRFGMVSVLCMPIRTNGSIVALVHLEASQAGYFEESHRQLMRPLLDLAVPVLEALAASRAVLLERDRLAESERRLREEAEENRELLARDWSFGRFVGRSRAVHELESTVRRAAGSPFPVLLTGETGTGKSILARILHSAGPRSKQPFVTVFCPSLDPARVESELFGHRRGAFTSADADRTGKVQKAEGGTLFLDEIGELPLGIQPKLLRLLQERAYERIGDPEERRADLRVIAATSLDLAHEVAAGRFRRDLYERLNYLPVRVPPLRDRRDDIAAILRHCLDRTDAGRWIELEAGAARFLECVDFSWPGNVRHIEQLAARLTIEHPARPVSAEELERQLDALIVAGSSGSGAPEAPGADARAAVARVAGRETAAAAEADEALARVLEEAERSWLAAALRRHPDLTRAELAARLQISESALYKKIKLYGLGH